MPLPKQVEDAGKAADEALAGPSSENPPADVPADLEPDESDDDLQTQLEKSEQKYKVLQGMYNSHVKPIKDDVNALIEIKGKLKAADKAVATAQQKTAKMVTANAEFVRQIKDLQGQLDSKAVQAAPAEIDVKQLLAKNLSEEDREALNVAGIEDDTIEIFAKLLSKPTQTPTPEPAADSTKAPPSGETDDDRVISISFWDGLDTAVPNWSAINKTPEWVAWLSEPAPYHKGKTRNDILIASQDDWDLETILSMFKEFMAGDTYKPEPVAAETTPDTDKPIISDSTENPLENEVEPDRSTNIDVNITPPGAAQAEVYGADGKTKVDIGYMLNPESAIKASDITLFYKDATQSDGLRVRNEELYDKIDAAIVKADQDGRVLK